MEARGLGSILAASLMFGLSGTSSASMCSVSDVTLGEIDANSCGSGPTPGGTPDSIANTPGDDPAAWDVNLNGNGGYTWDEYYKRDLNPDGTTPPTISQGGAGIDLQITSTGGNDAWDIGAFTVNADNPLLIVLGDGAAYEYTWYLFEGFTGSQNGAWDSTVPFEGKDVSNITAYTGVIPVPAAVWLFGSGLLGLVGVARRRRA